MPLPLYTVKGLTDKVPTGKTLTGATSYYNPAYGGVPQVSDPLETAKKAVTGNVANLPELYDLASKTNTFNAGQAAGQYALNLPQYGEMTRAAGANILDNLHGRLSGDVLNQLGQAAAERGVGGVNSNAAYLKALGLTSLGLQNTGQQQLTAAIGRTPTAQLFNPASFYISPDTMQSAQTGANLYASAPIPAYAQANALAAAQSGANRGYNSTAPQQGAGSQSHAMASEIASRYAPTAFGSKPSVPQPTQGWGRAYTRYPGEDGLMHDPGNDFDVENWLDPDPNMNIAMDGFDPELADLYAGVPYGN